MSRISLYCPDYVFHGTLLAACTLLKLIKSYPPTTFNEKDQSRAFFSAINICKDIAVVNNDVPAKISDILSKLWSSTKIYRDEYGDYIRALQVKNRLTMNVVFDCLWWWRKLSTNWLNDQPTRSKYESRLRFSGDLTPSDHSSVETLEPTRNEDDTGSLRQSFVDDSWAWDIDWGSLGPPGMLL